MLDWVTVQSILDEKLRLVCCDDAQGMNVRKKKKRKQKTNKQTKTVKLFVPFKKKKWISDGCSERYGPSWVLLYSMLFLPNGV